MTPGNVRGRAHTVKDRPGLRTRRKATLTCPRCGHVSPMDGDWLEVVASGEGESVSSTVFSDRTRLEIHCPDCYKYLTSRTLDRDCAVGR